MSGLKATLFGKFNVERENRKAVEIQAGKAQELFGYLLITRNRPQPRELLCGLLWGNQPQDKSKKHLRQALWRLQCALKATGESSEHEVLADEEWIQVNPSADFRLDIADFERVYQDVSGRPAGELTVSDFRSIQFAAHLYKGDLLEGWYQDWCLFERERFAVLYLILLDKLVEYCEIHQHYEEGLAYGAEILRHDRASERAHRQMMRLYSMTGDRTQALHQYKRCAAALRSDLDIEPSALTHGLYEQIRLDTFGPAARWQAGDPAPSLSDTLGRLERFSNELTRIQAQIRKEISALASTLPAPK